MGLDDEEGESTSITFNYQVLEITKSRIQVGWTVKEFACDQHSIEVQQIYKSNLTSTEVNYDGMIMQSDLSHAVIESNELFNSSYFRIVAIFENKSICSDVFSQLRIFDFGGK